MSHNAIIAVGIDGKAVFIEWVNQAAWMESDVIDELKEIEFDVTPGLYYANVTPVDNTPCGIECMGKSCDCGTIEWNIVEACSSQPTLHDQFAMAALQGNLAAQSNQSEVGVFFDSDFMKLSYIAFGIADSMMAARKQLSETNKKPHKNVLGEAAKD